MNASNGDDKSSGSEPWFSRQNVDVLFYRINRRPIGGDPSLFDPEPDLLAHIERVLRPSEPATSGYKHKRTWRLGNLRVDESARTFTGHFGWARTAEALGQEWDDESHAWTDRVISRDDSAVAPIAFVEKGRVLGILKHPSFTTESVLETVLTEMLNRGERNSGFPTTSWSVEPLGDKTDFYSWLAKVDQLLRLTLVFQRPNPDGEPEFQHLFERLDKLEAELIREEIVARDTSRGLDKEEIKADPTTQAFLSAAMVAFGRVIARGTRNGKKVKYDQRQNVLRQSLDLVGSDMENATNNVLNAVERTSSERIKYGKNTK